MTFVVRGLANLGLVRVLPSKQQFQIFNERDEKNYRRTGQACDKHSFQEANQ